MTTLHSDVPALCDAAIRLALGLHFDSALRILDATVPDADDTDARVRIALTAADVADRAEMVGTGAPAEPRFDELAKVLADTADVDPVLAWDADWVRLRRSYSRAIRNPDGSYRLGSERRDPAAVRALLDEALRVQEAAPDDVRRGWVSVCRGWITDNVVADRDAAPELFEAGLVPGRESGDDVLLFEVQRHLGDHAHDDGDLEDARTRWRESAAAGARAGHVGGTLSQSLLLAVLLRDEGDEAGARAVADVVGRWAAEAGVPSVTRQADGFLAGVDPTRPPEGQG
jgi:hypothetical protein